MVELVAKKPMVRFAPLEIGATRLSDVDLGHLTSVAPWQGQDAAASKALKEAHGMAFPSPNRATGKDGARAIWFGHRMALLAGPAPEASLAAHAALTDQSDAWTCVRLEGAASDAVLARVTPLDLRATQFLRGHTARTELQHMSSSITRVAADAFLILTFRSFADTLKHDLEQAMRGVAAREGG
ncbi:MAG: sarcosine oxidase subunit gamma [Pseudomonadota bacterium]